ncbi:atherin-like [Suricata suricatta]|uniref:atherin-like n=1 Tax=Suricata suricatta TaxID=37032 RepID=UPI001155771B|nr:atherin-like [Suricata suricatta]
MEFRTRSPGTHILDTAASSAHLFRHWRVSNLFRCVTISRCCRPRRADGNNGSRPRRWWGGCWQGCLRSLTRRNAKRSDPIGSRLAEWGLSPLPQICVCPVAQEDRPGLESGAEGSVAPEPTPTPAGASAALEAGVVSGVTPAATQEPAGDPAPVEGQPGPASDPASASAPPVPASVTAAPPAPVSLAATLGEPGDLPGKISAVPSLAPDTPGDRILIFIIIFLIFYFNTSRRMNVK